MRRLTSKKKVFGMTEVLLKTGRHGIISVSVRQRGKCTFVRSWGRGGEDGALACFDEQVRMAQIIHEDSVATYPEGESW